jgi:hypothetical protein
VPSLAFSDPAVGDPADRVTLDDSISTALLVVLESMTPAERVAFVLHDVFAMPFGEIAEVVGRTPAACRRLATSARRRVHSAWRGQIPRAAHDAAVRAFAAARKNPAAKVLELETPDGLGSYEWWYFDAHLDDGAMLVVIFMTKDLSTPGKRPPWRSAIVNTRTLTCSDDFSSGTGCHRASLSWSFGEHYPRRPRHGSGGV